MLFVILLVFCYNGAQSHNQNIKVHSVSVFYKVFL